MKALTGLCGNTSLPLHSLVASGAVLGYLERGFICINVLRFAASLLRK